MFKRFVVRLLIVSSIVTMSACGVVRNRANDYLKADSGKDLSVPKWYESDRIRARYPIAQVDNEAVATEDYEVPAPPDGTTLIVSERITIEEMDGQEWLQVTNTPGRAWPMLDKFLDSRGLETEHSNVELGLLQSTVFEAGKLSSEYGRQLGLDLEKYHTLQFRLTQGVKRNSSEVQVRVTPVAGLSPEFKAWGGQSDLKAIERQILSDLKLYMETNRNDKTFSLLAQDIGGPSKVRLVSEGEDAFLRFDLDYARSWGVLGRSIRDSGIFVVDLNRSEGLVLIKYEEEVEESLWGKLFSDDQDRTKPNYRLQMKDLGEFIRLDVSGMEPDAIERDDRVKLLSLLLENVS